MSQAAELYEINAILDDLQQLYAHGDEVREKPRKAEASVFPWQ
jgi:hypothetical protein